MGKKILAITICILLIITVVSCNMRKFSVTVESPLEFYTPVISSVPGFPLRVILPDEVYYGEYTFKWTTDSGRFLAWGDDGKITPLGRQTTIKENEIFWTPLEGSDELSKKTVVEVQIIRLEGGSVDSKFKFHIILQDDGLYVLDVHD